MTAKPSADIPSVYNAADVERRIYETWMAKDYFKAVRDPNAMRRFRKPGRRDRRTDSHLGTVHESRYQPQRMRLPWPESTSYDSQHRYREAPHRIELPAGLRDVGVSSPLPHSLVPLTHRHGLHYCSEHA